MCLVQAADTQRPHGSILPYDRFHAPPFKMKSLAPQTVATVSTLLFAAGLVSAQDLQLKAMTAKGCYKASGSTMLTDQGPYTFQSSGWCQKTCVAKGYPVMALWKGSNCLCGNELPPDSAKTSDSDCNTPCDGWPQDMCM